MYVSSISAEHRYVYAYACLYLVLKLKQLSLNEVTPRMSKLRFKSWLQNTVSDTRLISLPPLLLPHFYFIKNHIGNGPIIFEYYQHSDNEIFKLSFFFGQHEDLCVSVTGSAEICQWNFNPWLHPLHQNITHLWTVAHLRPVLYDCHSEMASHRGMK